MYSFNARDIAHIFFIFEGLWKTKMLLKRTGVYTMKNETDEASLNS